MFFCYNTYAQDCSILDPNEFGDCENCIGYVWSGELCAPVLSLDPPLTINQGEGLIARATYNNTTSNYVNFGLLSTDEMMIVFGLMYLE